VSRYLVTGCAGFIGSHLTETLLAAGHDVLGVDGFSAFYPRARNEENLAAARLDARLTLVEADLADVRPEPLVGEVDGVFHLAAQPGVRQSWGDAFAVYLRDNLMVTQRILEAAAEAGVRVVFASSSSVYGDAESYPTRESARPRPRSPYGVTKLSCEHLAEAYAAALGLDVVVLRYFSVYGPRQRPDMAFARIVSALLGGDVFPLFGSGGQVRDFTYVADVVAATVAAMERAPAGAVYNVGGGSPTSLAEAIALCERISGRSLTVERRPLPAGDPPLTAADTSRIRSELGWTPQASLAEGLAAQIAWQARSQPALAASDAA
jgi:nucleoside-diphosphate-sugar epimerase